VIADALLPVREVGRSRVWGVGAATAIMTVTTARSRAVIPPRAQMRGSSRSPPRTAHPAAEFTGALFLTSEAGAAVTKSLNAGSAHKSRRKASANG